MLLIFTTVYGVIGALSGLLQLQKIHHNASAEDISMRFLAIYYGGYWIWLFYGLVQKDIALIIVDLTGIIVVSFTFIYALKTKINENGYTLKTALFDKNVSLRNPSLFANSHLEKIGKKPPKTMKNVVYSKIYPLRYSAKIKDESLCLEEIKQINIDSIENKLFFKPVGIWRQVDCGKRDWQEWRRILLDLVEHDAADSDQEIFEAVNRELSRPKSKTPAPARINLCRAFTISTAAQILKTKFPDDTTLDLLIRKLKNFKAITSSEQRWMEQLLATYYLDSKKTEARVTPIRLSFPDNWIINDDVFIADKIWSELLWPRQIGANNYWGNPNVIEAPVIKQNWVNENNTPAIANSLLKHYRFDSPIRNSFLHPIDYSLLNGWQALSIEKFIADTKNLFPLEKAFLVALGKEAGWKKEQIPEIIKPIKPEHTVIEFAKQISINVEQIIYTYENNYRKIAKKALPVTDSLDEKRLEELWLCSLN